MGIVFPWCSTGFLCLHSFFLIITFSIVPEVLTGIYESPSIHSCPCLCFTGYSRKSGLIRPLLLPLLPLCVDYHLPTNRHNGPRTPPKRDHVLYGWIVGVLLAHQLLRPSKSPSPYLDESLSVLSQYQIFRQFSIALGRKARQRNHYTSLSGCMAR